MRLIDADNVMDTLYNTSIELYRSEYEEFQREIDKIPTIDPESLRPTAKWIITKTNIFGVNCYECSCCHEHRYNAKNAWENRMKYCACCGARMVSTDE